MQLTYKSEFVKNCHLARTCTYNHKQLKQVHKTTMITYTSMYARKP